MAKLEWDKVGERFYETGTSKGVLYPQDNKGTYPKGVVWNGLISVSESPSGAEASDLYADDIKYATLRSAETFGCTIEAYTYPDEFASCDGSKEVTDGVFVGQQARNSFGFSYRTVIGNDTSTEEDDGYKIHMVYGATASPSEKAYSTINDSPEAITFSWEVTTTPVNVPGSKPTATLIIDSRKADKDKLAALEEILYGSESKEARLPLPEEVINLFKETAAQANIEG